MEYVIGLVVIGVLFMKYLGKCDEVQSIQDRLRAEVNEVSILQGKLRTIGNIDNYQKEVMKKCEDYQNEADKKCKQMELAINKRRGFLLELTPQTSHTYNRRRSLKTVYLRR